MFTREQVPILWGEAKKGLGRALLGLQILTEERKFLRPAVKCLEEAVSVQTQREDPLTVAQLQSLLATGLVRLERIADEGRSTGVC